ncbi:MAG: DUF6062 family protein [Spirochaetales bacterium]|nr:DUF6062 family protein [Spirochaetales bacterium]
MKYELETIPVWDAIKEDTECLFCRLYESTRERYLDFYLGSSVMNPETRVRVNQSGFCPAHYADLVARRKAHGLGLMTHTYLQEYMNDLVPALEEVQKKARKGAKKKVVPLISKDVAKAEESLSRLITDREESCLICDDIERTMNRYYFTLAYLWKRDEEFKQALRESKGICLHHLKGLLPLAQEALNPKELMVFLDELMELEKKNVQRLEGELKWFTLKFDSQNNGKPWGEGKNAHKRTIQKLTGREFELEPVPDF